MNPNYLKEVNMRELVFDTETTGFYADKGDRIIEIGMVELVDRKLTNNNLHMYFNPEKEISKDAIEVHKITNEFLFDKPLFSEKAKEIFDYIGSDSKLIAHNASFDMSFLNMELKKAGFPIIEKDRFIDTLSLSRKKYPQYSKHSLDAICNRLDISLSEREKQGHGALLDSLLLVKVYFDLTDKKELDFAEDNKQKQNVKIDLLKLYNDKTIKNFRTVFPSQIELDDHDSTISKIKDSIWLHGD